MKKNQERALNAFAAMESLPDGMILEAEQALIAAESGVIAPVKKPKPKGGFARFMSSGRTAAVLSGIVALAVLILVLRAGKEPTVYPPPVQPAGSTIEMSDHGVNFTIATELENYPDGTDLIKVVMTGKVKGEPFSGFNGWHLERIAEGGCEFIPISYGFLGLDSIKPDRNEYPTDIHRIHIYGTTLKAGSYRLHATEYDGEKPVSVAWCEFTVGNPNGNTETPPIVEYPPADERPYTVTTPDSIGYGTAELPVTVMTTATDVDLVFHRNYRIVKLIGPANGPGADWVPDLEAVRESPGDGHGGYAVFEDYLTLPTPEDWLPGLYRLYALNDGGEYIDYCDFLITGDHGRAFEMFLNETAITTLHTALSAKIIPHEKGVPFGGGNQWALYRVEGEERTLIGSRSTEEAFEPPEVAPDEFCVVSRFAGIMDLTGDKNLPAGRYELVYDPNGHAVTLPFTVAESPTVSFETAFPGFRISLPENAYLYDKPNGLVTNRGIEDPGPPEHITDESLPATRTITVDGKEYTLTYWYTQSRNSPTDTDYYTYTQPGHADGEWSILAIYPHGSDQLAEVNYRCRDGFLLNGLPTTQAEAQTVADARVKELMGSLPRSSNYRYDADSNRHTVTYHSTAPLINTAGASIYKLSNADIVQIRVSLSRFDEAQIHADIGNLNVSLLTASLEDFLTRYYKDSSITFEGLEEGVSATAGPRFHYTATVTVEGQRQSISVQVYQGGLKTDDPDKMVARARFLWADGSPMLDLNGYGLPVLLLTEDRDSIIGLRTGDLLEVIISRNILETAPATTQLYDFRRVTGGSMADVSREALELLEESGYSVTEGSGETVTVTGRYLPERTVSLLIPEEGDPILLRIREGYGISYEELSTGDLVEVTILNRIMETYPAQTDLFAIRKLSDGSSSDIPADVLAKLDENSWYREED
ncbi:MAG: hypothetical protein IJ363_04195 [Clostridia bacterium]|nr:hypothetical protein [Clostridia bacterium]